MLEVRLGVSPTQVHSGPQCRETDTRRTAGPSAQQTAPLRPAERAPEESLPAQNPAETPKRASVDLCCLGPKVQRGGRRGLTPPSPHTRQQ